MIFTYRDIMKWTKMENEHVDVYFNPERTFVIRHYKKAPEQYMYHITNKMQEVQVYPRTHRDFLTLIECSKDQ